jgi:hypothetical protein
VNLVTSAGARCAHRRALDFSRRPDQAQRGNQFSMAEDRIIRHDSGETEEEAIETLKVLVCRRRVRATQLVSAGTEESFRLESHGMHTAITENEARS